MKATRYYFVVTLTLFFLVGFTPIASAQDWVWGRRATGTGVDAWSIATDPFGNVFAAGCTTYHDSIRFGSYVLPPHCAACDPEQSFWVKYDNSGTVLWAGGTSEGKTNVNNITADASGNLIVFGQFESPTMKIGSFVLTNSVFTWLGTRAVQYFLAKISPTGTILWATASNGSVAPVFSGLNTATSVSVAGGVATDTAGNIYVTASFDNASINIGAYTLFNTDPSGRTFDIFVAKYTPAGVVAWVSSIGGAADDYGAGITVSATDKVYVTGSFRSPSMTVGAAVISDPFVRSIAFIAKFSTAGTPLWAQAAGGANGAFGIAVASDNDGNVYMTGGFRDLSISFGGVVVSRVYPGTVPQYEQFLVKYSPADIVTWSKAIGSATTSGWVPGVWPYSVAVAPCGQVWVSGYLNADVNIDGSILTFPTPFPPLNDHLFIAGYNSAGVIGYSALGSGGDDNGNIACDGSGNVFVCSDYIGTALHVGPDVLLYDDPALRYEFFYVGKYANISVSIDTNHTHIDTSLCSGTGITLTAPAGYTNYYWDNGSTLATRTVTAAGIYKVFCVTCGVPTLLDSFIVTIIPQDTTHMHTNIIFCGIDSMALTAPTGYAAYYWEDGTTSSIRSITTPGIYRVYCFKCGISTLLDSFIVSYPDTVNAHTNASFVCGTGGTTLAAPAGYTYYYWDDGSTFPTRNITSAGIYRVYCISCGMPVLLDSFIVTTTLQTTHKKFDTIICEENAIVLHAPPGDTSYLWSDGSGDTAFPVNHAGVFWVKAFNGCQLEIDSFTISTKDFVFKLSQGETVCAGVPVQISVEIPPADVPNTFRWTPVLGLSDTNILNTIFRTTDPGTYKYYLTIQSMFGCTATDSVTYHVVPPIHTVVSPPEAAIPYGNYIQLEASNTGQTGDFFIYYWMPDDGSLSNPNINNPIAGPFKTTTYTVIAMNKEGCRDTASVNISVVYDEICIPDAFTPNDDGLNDVFRICSLHGNKLVVFNVYNRWGQLVYHNAGDPLAGWDGTYNGVKQELGVYQYMISIVKPDGADKMYKGDVTLVR